MRDVIAKAYAGAQGMVGNVVQKMQAGNVLTPDELKQRYVAEHRGKPEALLRFAISQAPKGANPMQAAHEYEQQMEQLLKGGQ